MFNKNVSCGPCCTIWIGAHAKEIWQYPITTFGCILCKGIQKIMVDIEEYTNEMAIQDLSVIIAQMTSGGKGAIPEQADFDIAKKVLVNIENGIYDG